MRTARTAEAPANADSFGVTSDSPTSLVNDISNVFSEYRLEYVPVVVVAVSGGSDSTALLLLLKNWLTIRSPATRVVAVTIDHRLREASAREAADMGQLAARLGIEHRI